MTDPDDLTYEHYVAALDAGDDLLDPDDYWRDYATGGGGEMLRRDTRAHPSHAHAHLSQRRYSQRRWYPLTREDKAAIAVVQAAKSR